MIYMQRINYDLLLIQSYSEENSLGNCRMHLRV